MRARKIVWRIISCSILFVALLSSACSDDPDDESGVIGTGILLRGNVTAFAGVPSDRIDVKSSNAQFTELALDANGEFNTATLRGSGPWLLRALTGGDRALYGIAYEDGRRNINSFSDLVLRNWFEQRSIDIDKEFASSQRIPELPTALNIADTTTNMFALIEPVLNSYQLNGEEIITGEFNDTSSGLGAFLSQNSVIIANGLVSFVVTDPITMTQSATLSPLALNSDFLDSGSTGPSTPGETRALGSAPDEIVLVWEPSIDDVSVLGYRVIRDGELIATTPYPVYIDSDVQPNQTYSYQIAAIDGAGNASDPTAPVIASGLLAGATEPPPAPTLLTEIAVTGSTVQFLWVQSQIGEVVSFNVYRGTNNQALQFLVGVTSTRVSDVNVRENETYCYQVAAVNVAGVESERSDVLCVNTANTDPLDDGMEPLGNWIVPSMDAINALTCESELRSEAVQSGVTVITEACVRVPETLVIGATATLRVDAGVVMIFGEGSSLVVPRDATLTIDGTFESPVVLTSSVAVPGHWGGVEFQQSTSPGNLLRGAVIQYGGGAESRAGVAIAKGASRFRMEDTLVRFSRTNGFSFNLFGSVIDSFQGNRITQNGRVGGVSLNLLQSLAGNSDFTGNTVDDIGVPRTQYERSMVIPNLGVPISWGGVTIRRAALTIDPGVELIMLQNSVIRVDGVVNVNGTAEEPIVIRGKVTSQGQGSWVGLELSGRGAKSINHTRMSYAGAAGEGNGAIRIECSVAAAATVQINHVDITDSASWGIFIDGDGCVTELGNAITYFNNALGDTNVP